MKSSWHIIFASLWVLLGPLLVIVSVVLVFKFAPQVMWSQAAAYLNPVTSNEFHHIVLTARGGGPSGVWTEAEVTIWGNYGDAHAVVDMTSLQVLSACPINASIGMVATGPGNTSPQPLTGQEVLNWFSYAKANTNNKALIDEANEIAAIIQHIPHHQMMSPKTTHVMFLLRAKPIYGPPGWLVASVVLFWALAIIVSVITHVLFADWGRGRYQAALANPD